MQHFEVNGVILDDYQMQILQNNSNQIVIAGAGAGKSLTIIGKINYLIEIKHINPENILLISFTNASVNDLVSKVKYNIPIFTFHKLAIHILNLAHIDYNLCSTTLLNYIINEALFTCDSIIQKNILKFLNLSCPYNEFLKSNYLKSFSNFIETFINLWKTNGYDAKTISLNYFSKNEKIILLFIFNIYLTYILEKNGTNSMDFDDLILNATNYVKNLSLNYKYIIIDEFQDTSLIRLNLIKQIVKYSQSKIIVVGDDWQSIYKFSGCDLNIFLNFTNLFSEVATIKLINTYRNCQELINIASKFILKNPKQIVKKLYSPKSNKDSIVLVPYKNGIIAFKKLLNYLLKFSKDIMILSRNNHDILNYIDNEFQLINNTLIYKETNFKYYTIHRSKGLESQYVIVLNCNNDYLGLPNKIINNPILNKVFRESEIKFAEERRLFYVALTRCKDQVFLLYQKNTPSIFIKEIKKIIKKETSELKYF